MKPVVPRAVTLAVLCLLISWPTSAQNRTWFELYRDGREAVGVGRNEDGIRLLTQAIKIEPTQQRDKTVRPGQREDYFPYYYLGLAYLRTRQFDRADTAFRNARACRCLTSTLSDLQDAWEKQLTQDRAAAEKIDPALVARLSELETALADNRYNEALSLLQTIRDSNPSEYTRRGLDKRRADVERALATRLVNEGQQLLANGDLAAARARFQEAESRVPGSGQAGLTAVRQRQSAEYTRFRQTADAEFAAGRVDAALEQLRQAEAIHPEQYAADGLAARAQEWRQALQKSLNADKLRSLVERARTFAAANNYAEAAKLYRTVLNTEENPEAKAWLDAQGRFISARDRARKLHADGQFDLARQALDDARRHNEQRFKFEGLDALLASIEEKLGTLPEEQVGPVRVALVAYLKGDAKRARDLLEPMAQNGATLDPRVHAHVLAFLGVAYADMSIAARDENERSSLRGKAVEHFRALLAVQPEYQLRESLISPRVREILEEVRIRR